MALGCGGAGARPQPRRAGHAPAVAAALGRIVFGASVRGRPLVAWNRGDPAAARRLLVIGLIHGDEPAGLEVTRALRPRPVAAGAELAVVNALNPDGRRAGTRQNARGVDLNRNFPVGFTAAGAPGDVYYPGPRALSEPETRAARRLILRLRPTVTIWFHQHLDLVDASGGDARIERRFARAVGMRLVRLSPYPGSATRWQNAHLPGSTAFVVELPAGRLGAVRTAVFVRAIAALERG